MIVLFLKELIVIMKCYVRSCFIVQKRTLKVKKEIFEYNTCLIAHNGSCFDSHVVLNNVLQWRNVVNLIKNGAGIVSLKIFNDCVNKKKKNPQYVHFRYGRVHN